MLPTAVSKEDLRSILAQGAEKITDVYQEYRTYFPNTLMAEIGLTDLFMLEVAKKSAGRPAKWVSLAWICLSRLERKVLTLETEIQHERKR